MTCTFPPLTMGDKRVAAGVALDVRPDICCTRDHGPRRLPHVTLLMSAGGSATGLSATGACIVRVLWPMMARRCALSMRLSRGFDLLFLSHHAVEPLARTAYTPDSRAWPCLSRTSRCAFL